jgi:hypothetical protein
VAEGRGGHGTQRSGGGVAQVTLEIGMKLPAAASSGPALCRRPAKGVIPEILAVTPIAAGIDSFVLHDAIDKISVADESEIPPVDETHLIVPVAER